MQYVEERTNLMKSGADINSESCLKSDAKALDYFNKEVLPVVSSCEDGIAKITAMQIKDSNDANVAADKSALRISLILVILIIAASVIGIVIGLLVSANIKKTIASIVSQVNDVAEAVLGGNAHKKADVEQTNIEFREIPAGLNKVIEAFYSPLQMSYEFIGTIGKGVIPQKNNVALKGYFEEIRNSANNCIDGLQGLVEVNNILQKMAVNDYTVKVEGNYQGIYNDVCGATNLVRERVLHIINICQNISDGNLVDLADLKHTGKRSENDRLIPSVIKMSEAINSLIIDANNLANAAMEGKLGTRADASKHQGDFGKVIEGINSTLDAVVQPVNVAAECLSRISIGDMPPVITAKYNGDFNLIINNLNVLINALNEIILKARLVAEGDLTIDMKKRSDNDQLMQSLTDMVKATANIISEFQSAANNISASSQQMSSTSQQMSQGASEQASSTEEVSSSMEEMAANIQQNTENARQTEKIALNASEGIAKTAEAAQTTLKYMQEITDKVSIIGEIARQTNILALNAAVEAARAGEYGKGFAVVAAEVRKLAERSQVAAVEIDALTKTSLRTTEEAGKMMAAIVPEISKTGKLVQEIAAASIEQNSGADQVNNAIQQLNQVTQQNAAASEEMATSSEELASQAQELLETISFFKLEAGNDFKKKLAVNDKGLKPATHVAVAHIDKKEHALHEMKHKGININMGKDNLDSNYEKF